MAILILTGPSASGKNTISQILAQKREKCAVIDVDLVRWMYRRPHKAPWDGDGGMIQQKIGVENACLLAQNFIKNRLDVVILDVVVTETAALYRSLLPEAKIILLMPSHEETLKRFKSRPHSITDDEFELVYEWERQLTDFDKKIDNTDLTAEQTAALLNDFF